jgi:hypothetical protein
MPSGQKVEMGVKHRLLSRDSRRGNEVDAIGSSQVTHRIANPLRSVDEIGRKGGTRCPKIGHVTPRNHKGMTERRRMIREKGNPGWGRSYEVARRFGICGYLAEDARCAGLTHCAQGSLHRLAGRWSERICRSFASAPRPAARSKALRWVRRRPPANPTTTS